MLAALRRLVRERAGGRCEYCRIRAESSLLVFHVEHIIPHQHGGVTSEENLALSCPSCNLHKGPNLTGIDPDTGEICRLFHPRADAWEEHFVMDGARLCGLTAIGRVTVWVLDANAEDQLERRARSR
jgi:hypothetical protein